MTFNLPNGNEPSEIILPNGVSASEVKDPLGNTVWSAIPDTQITRPEDDGTNNVSSKAGMVINPNVDLEGLKAVKSGNVSGMSTAYIIEVSSGTVLGQTDVSALANNEDFIIDGISMTAGTDYALVGDDGGATYTWGQYSPSDYPLTGDAFDVTERYYSGGAQGGGSYINFNDIRNLDY